MQLKLSSINTIHVKQQHNFFVVSKGILHVLFQNSLEEKIFQWSNFQLIPLRYYVRPFQEISNTCVAKCMRKYH